MNTEQRGDEFWYALDSAVGDFCLKTVVPAKNNEWNILSEMIGEEWEWSGSQAVLGMAVSLNMMKHEHLQLKQQLEENHEKCQHANAKLSEERHLSSQLLLSKLSVTDRNTQLHSEVARLKSKIEQLEREQLHLGREAAI